MGGSYAVGKMAAVGTPTAVRGGANTFDEYLKAKERADRLSRNDRSGKNFTKAGKEAVIELNRLQHNGRTVCVNCGIETISSKKSVSNVTPPKNETQVDHKYPKSKGGSGTPDNGQVLCRSCNREKSNR